MVLERKNQLIMGIAQVENQLSNELPGTLRISEKDGRKQYYYRQEPWDTEGKYIRKKDWGLVVKLAQQDYYQKILKKLKDELDILNTFSDIYDPKCLEKVYMSLHENRKELVTPLLLDDEEYVRQWKSVEYPKMGFREDMPDFYTDEGVRVRSKSEIIIANNFSKKKVPYRYEFPIELSEYLILHPDFLCLNVRTRKEYIWEHFGMMDIPEYARNAVKKIEEYEKAGYFLGINFIATFESTEKPLNSVLLEKTIETYLL